MLLRSVSALVLYLVPVSVLAATPTRASLEASIEQRVTVTDHTFGHQKECSGLLPLSDHRHIMPPCGGRDFRGSS